MMNLSLKYRIAVIIFALEAVMMAVVLWQTLGFARSETEKQLIHSEEAILEVVSGITRVALLTEEYAELQIYTEDLLKEPRIKQALIVDIQGRVVASSDLSLIGHLPPTDMRTDKSASDSASFWRIKPVHNSTGQLGVLAIKLSNEALLKASSDAQRLGISIAMVGMIIIAIIGVLVGIVLTRQLERVTNTARAFATGNQSARTGLQGKDEISVLGQTFDQMAEAIVENQKQLEQTIAERTSELEARNKELEAFSYSVSHDLRTPLRGIDGFSQALLEDYHEKLDEEGKNYLQRVRGGVQKMGSLIDDLLTLSRTSQANIKKSHNDLSELCQNIFHHLAELDASHSTEVYIEEGMQVYADKNLLSAMMENLLGNAWKYTSKTDKAKIEVRSMSKGNEKIFIIKDNGAGFDMRHIDKLFNPFQRLHKGSEFSGSGIGLATVHRIILKHGGRIWAEAEPGKGAIFYFTFPNNLT